MDDEQQLGEELFYACCRDGDLWRVRELLKRGADVNWKNSLIGWTPLIHACLYNRSDIVKELLKYNPELNEQTNYDDTALHSACRDGYRHCVKLLLATGQCDLGVVNKCGHTPLGEAVVWNRLNVVKYLITEHGVDVNAQVTKSGDTMLGLAVHKRQLDIIKYLVTECSDSVNVSTLSRQILELSIHRGELDFIKYLVNKLSVNVNAPVTKSGDTMLGLAVRKGQIDVIKHLVTKCSVSGNAPVTKS